MEEVINYVKKYKGEEFIRMDKILKADFNICFLIGARNIGKSLQTMAYILKDCINNNKQFVYIRNTEIELKSSNVITSFFNYIYYACTDFLDDCIIKSDGIYYKNNKRKLCTFLYFSKSKNTKSQGELNDVKWIVYEEFINPDFICKNCINRFADIFKTYQRNNIIKTIFLGNKDDLLENDFLIEFGIDFNLDDTNNQIIINKNRKILGILINYPLRKKELLDVQKQYENIFENTTAEQYTKGLNFLSRCKKDVYSWNYHNINNHYKPLYKLSWHYCTAVVGLWNDKLYVKELFSLDEYKNVPEYALDMISVNSNNHLIKDYSILDVIYNYIKTDGLYYSSVYIKQEFKHIIMSINYEWRNQKIQNEGGL